MADWKKEIKLSDLLARDTSGEHDEAKPLHEEPQRPVPIAAEPSHQAGPAHDEPVGAESDASEQDVAEARPFWKRELKFGRRKEAGSTHDFDAPDGEGEERPKPFWKRELGSGRRQDASQSDPDLGASEYDSEHTPFWKKQVSLGRRRNDLVQEAPFDAVEPTHEQEPVRDGVSDLAADENAPFWKRQLSFGRAKDPDSAHQKAEKEKRSFFAGVSLRRSKDPTFDAPERRREKNPRPFFKREFSFRRGNRGAHQAAGAPAAKGGRKKQQLVGLKVGASQIAAAHVVNGGSPELHQLARQPLEQGIVVGGELRDPEALAEALRDFFARHKLPNRNVRLGIGNNRIGVRSFEISGVHDPKQLENAIRFRAQEALPIPLDEAVLDYQVIDESVSPTGIRTYRVLLVVAYRELVDRYIAACRGAGLRLVGIDLEAFALLRALSPPPSEVFPEDTALVAVSIGHDRSTFAVSTGTVCEFTRVLDWGGSSLNTAIARELDITPAQAEPIKRAFSLSTENGEPATANDQTARAQEAVRLELQSFARELVSSLHFYQNQTGSLAIGTIVLTGGTAHMPGLAAELQRLIGAKVRVGDPLRRVKSARRVEAPDQVGSLAIAIGLGIED